MLVIIGTTTLVPSGDAAGRRGEGYPQMEDGMGNSRMLGGGDTSVNGNRSLNDETADSISYNGRKGLLLPGEDEMREDGLFNGEVLKLIIGVGARYPGEGREKDGMREDGLLGGEVLRLITHGEGAVHSRILWCGVTGLGKAEGPDADRYVLTSWFHTCAATAGGVAKLQEEGRDPQQHGGGAPRDEDGRVPQCVPQDGTRTPRQECVDRRRGGWLRLATHGSTDWWGLRCHSRGSHGDTWDPGGPGSFTPGGRRTEIVCHVVVTGPCIK